MAQSNHWPILNPNRQCNSRSILQFICNHDYHEYVNTIVYLKWRKPSFKILEISNVALVLQYYHYYCPLLHQTTSCETKASSLISTTCVQIGLLYTQLQFRAVTASDTVRATRDYNFTSPQTKIVNSIWCWPKGKWEKYVTGLSKVRLLALKNIYRRLWTNFLYLGTMPCIKKAFWRACNIVRPRTTQRLYFPSNGRLTWGLTNRTKKLLTSVRIDPAVIYSEGGWKDVHKLVETTETVNKGSKTDLTFIISKGLQIF